MVSTIIRGLEYPGQPLVVPNLEDCASQFRNNSRDGSSSSVWISDLCMAGSSDCTRIPGVPDRCALKVCSYSAGGNIQNQCRCHGGSSLSVEL